MLFTGEMVFPWLFDDCAPLAPFREAAHLLAAKSDWPALYDVNVLRTNTVPVAAATYVDDMYVDYNLAQESIRDIPNVRQWVTNEFKHRCEVVKQRACLLAGDRLERGLTPDCPTAHRPRRSGIRDDGGRIFDRLLSMARDALLLD